MALIGGSWTDAVAAGNRAIGYRGQIWRVNPRRASTPGCRYYASVDELPGSPDQAFIAVPARAAIGVAAALERHRAGGFVCFASGFSELGTAAGRQLTDALVAAAPSVPFFGPNCYGIANFFDRCALLPDQVVGAPLERGVALICQSGTIGLTLTFNGRSVPIGYLFTVGNQTRLAVEDLIELLCADERVSAFGLYVEGIKDLQRFAQAAERARAVGKPIALVKAGRTEAAARTAQTHTGALTGADASFDAFCRAAGIARCETLAGLCETLKLLHAGGPLPGRRVLVMGFSGGDIAMTADVARHGGLQFPSFDPDRTAKLRGILGERVTIGNPFDVHTYAWFDLPRLRSLFDTTLACGLDAVALMLDCPPETADTTAFTNVISEFVAASAAPGASRSALLASLPETIPPSVRAQCLSGGVAPLQGQREALEALDLCAAMGEAWSAGAAVRLLRPAGPPSALRLLSEFEAKAALQAFGVPVPRSRLVAIDGAVAAAAAIGYPVVMKAADAALAHKSDVGGVILDIRDAAAAAAAAAKLRALSGKVLVEEMVVDGVAEILVGAIVDPQFGLTLVFGAGGVLTELLHESVSLLPPFTAAAVRAALARLRVQRLLAGFRGKPSGDIAALVAAILAVGRYAEANLGRLAELDVNPLIVRPAGRGAVAVDALIRIGS
ncbi:MAG: acetate--CoA ligase family protein [Gammaproteobacteria bacterium]|nr:acetate--CoA ligase family protein [Gammaproteobacteria bacterium]